MVTSISSPSGEMSLPAAGAGQATGALSRWTRLLKAIVNSSASLFSVPLPDSEQALRQAQRLGLRDCASAADLIASLKMRLSHPQALLLMQPQTAGWLPAMVQPQLSDRQQHQLICWLLNAPQLDCHRLARECPDLYHTLIDQISQAAAQCDHRLCAVLLPPLLRSAVLMKGVSLLHPQLPLVLWLAQVLWQMHQQGLVQTLDSELRAQLTRCLLQLDDQRLLPEAARQALAGETLWRMINHWAVRRLPEISPAPAVIASSGAEPSPLRLLPAAGWQVNSALNRAAEADGELLIRVQSCYELLQQHNQPVNFATGCAATAVNQSFITQEASNSELTRSLVINAQGEMLTCLRLESGESSWRLQGVRFPAQARPQALQQLAGPDDWLTFFAADGSQEAETVQQLTAAAVKLTLRQLGTSSASGALRQKIRSVIPVTGAAPEQAGSVSSATGSAAEQAGSVSSAIDAALQQVSTVVSGLSRWPFSGVLAAEALPPDVAVSEPLVSVKEFIFALKIKYPSEAASWSAVVVSQIRNRGIRDVMDTEVPLSQALEMIQQRETGSPPLLLNFHPAWSKNLADDIHDYLSGKSSAPYNTSLPIAWDSAENQRAARQIGVGHSRRNLENLIAMMKKIKSPLWNRKEWFDVILRKLVISHGDDPEKIKTHTPVKIFVRMPSSYSRQHLPLDAQLDGTLQQIYNNKGENYTILDIITGEYKRENIRAESKIIEFPATVSKELRQAMQSVNLQKQYISELEIALAEGEIRQGMLELFNLLFERALASVYENYQESKLPFSLDSIRQAVRTGDVYQLKWFGYALHNLIFICVAQPNENKSQGLIVSLWDGQIFPVSIDRLASVSFYTEKKARQLLKLIENSLPIPGRVKAEGNAGIYNDQIIINTSGRYQVEFHGKAFLKTSWLEPVASQCVLSLNKIVRLDAELLFNFARSLQLDMDYLVLTDKEHQMDTAIEVLETVGTLVSFFTIPMAITSAVGATGVATKLLAQIGSWRSSAIVTSATAVFPNLVKKLIADRPEDRDKAGTLAMLILGSEGVSFLLNKYGVRVISGLIYQGNRAVNIGYDMLPKLYTNRINYYSNRYFLSYKNIVMRSLGVDEAIPLVTEHYDFPFIDMKAPPPLGLIKEHIGELAGYVFNKVEDAAERAATVNSVDKVLSHIQGLFSDKGYSNEIGAIISWNGVESSQPYIDYIVKINCPAPDVGSPFHETENVLIESAMTPGGFSHLIAGEDNWIKDIPLHPKYLDKAVCVKWFSDMQQAKSWSQSLLSGQGMNARLFDRLMIHRPLWYKRSIVSDKFKDLERRQSMALQEIYARENEISLDDVKIYSTDTLSLKLSYLYSSMAMVGVDLLAEKFHLLSSQDICKEATDLPEGDFLVIPTELRGMSCSDLHNITLTNYAVPRALLLHDKIQAYPPSSLAEAAREAVSSSLYAPAVDQRLLRNKRNKHNPLLQKRLWRLKQSSGWLQQRMDNIRVPLLLVVDRGKLDASAITADNRVNATLPTAAISFVLTLDNHHQPISDILSLMRDRPLPVTPLLIQDKAAWQKARFLADKYSMFPQVASAHPEMSEQGYRPWMSIIELQVTSGLISAATAQLLRQQTRADDYHSLLGIAPVRISHMDQLDSITPGARLLFLDVSSGPGLPPLSHMMMALGEGEASGSNNQLIGGKAGWEIIWLKLCPWVEDSEQGFVIEVDNYQYSLYVQTTSRLATQPPPADPQLDQQAIKVISLAEQHVAQPAQISGVSASWEKLLFLYRHAGVINMENFTLLSQQTSATEYRLFTGKGAQLVRSRYELTAAAPGSRLIFVEPPQKPGDPPRMVHAMIVSEWGAAIGVDNYRIGGGGGWEKIRLSDLLSHPDTRHGLLIESGEYQQHCIISPPLIDALVSAG